MFFGDQQSQMDIQASESLEVHWSIFQHYDKILKAQVLYKQKKLILTPYCKGAISRDDLW